MQPEDLLLTLYQENILHARQHENLRERATAFCGAIAAALLAFAANGGLTPRDRPIGFALVAVGLLGSILSLKHYERFRRHSKIAGAFRREVEVILGVSSSAQYNGAVQAHNSAFPLLHRIRLYWVWVAFNLAVSAMGVWIAFICR
jgi:hypothetical protein